MFEILIVLGVIVLSFALRSTGHRITRKLGALGILVATFVAFYFFTDSIAGGVGGMLLWFLLPWIELLTRVRRLRLPLSKSLERQAPPGASRFPDLTEITDEVEEEGFEYVADTGWDWEGMNQFYRLFYREETREQASICLTEQDGIAWVYLSVTSRHPRGETYRTSNVPFSSPMKMAPDVRFHQAPQADSFADLLQEHRFWLEGFGMSAEDLVEEDVEMLSMQIEEETGRQIRHNLDAGLVETAETEEMVRYSWRGLFYLYFQLVKDMVRMA
jgi:hypothetical protein